MYPCLVLYVTDVKNEDTSVGSPNDLVVKSEFLENANVIKLVKCQEVVNANHMHDWFVFARIFYTPVSEIMIGRCNTNDVLFQFSGRHRHPFDIVENDREKGPVSCDR